MKTNPPQLTQFGRCFMQLYLIFALLLLAWRPKVKKAQKPVQLKINFDSPPEEYHNDWDEFGLVSRLTLEEFRKYPGCENISEEEAHSKIEAMYWLSIIGFNIYKKQTEQSIFVSQEK